MIEEEFRILSILFVRFEAYKEAVRIVSDRYTLSILFVRFYFFGAYYSSTDKLSILFVRFTVSYREVSWLELCFQFSL